MISTHFGPLAIHESTVEKNTLSHQRRRSDLADVCAPQGTRSSPICGLCPRTFLHHARRDRRKATCFADNLDRRDVRSDRKHRVVASGKNWQRRPGRSDVTGRCARYHGSILCIRLKSYSPASARASTLNSFRGTDHGRSRLYQRTSQSVQRLHY